MPSVPVERSEIEWFTPDSLKDALGDDAPAFRLKAPSERCVRRFRQLCEDEGLEHFSDAEFTAEKLRAISEYWSADDAASITGRLQTILAMQAQNIEITAEDLAWVDHLDDQLFNVHKPLRVMRRKSGEFNEYAPRFALAVYVAGWKNIDVPFKLDGGVIEEATVTRLIKRLRDMGKQHSPDAAGTPFLELYVAASKRLRLDEEEEKNSQSPSQPSSNPDVSTKTPSTAGESSEESSVESTSSSSSAPAIPQVED